MEKAYALACFNVVAHNRNVQSEHFSFLLDDVYSWVFASADGLTISDWPGGEQRSMVMGESRNPGVEQLMAVGKEHGLKNAPRIRAQGRMAVSRWRHYAAAADVSARSTNSDCGRNQRRVSKYGKHGGQNNSSIEPRRPSTEAFGRLP